MKVIVPLILAVIFMYAMFAASYYFDTLWFRMPTMILCAFIALIMSCFSIANLKEHITPKKK